MQKNGQRTTSGAPKKPGRRLLKVALKAKER
jgi:hypothetical protein